jgi:small subunit ribosomal protein S21
MKVDKERKKLQNCSLYVTARSGEQVESMIRRFKKNVKISGLMKEIKERSCYEKPSVIKRRKKKSLILRKKHLTVSNNSVF